MISFAHAYVPELMLSVFAASSVQVPDGAYHLTSSLPVMVYQFNPLDFDKNGTFSHSNDASLLLPTHVLSTNYIVMARQTFGVGHSELYTFIPGRWWATAPP